LIAKYGVMICLMGDRTGLSWRGLSWDSWPVSKRFSATLLLCRLAR
jgi:hypothetical protein